MIKKPVGVTDAELAVLKVLWARGPLSAKAITEAVYPDGAESSLPPSIRSCSGWSAKDWSARDRSAFVHVFSPAASPADILGQELDTLVERPGGRLDRALDHAVDRSETAQQERGRGDSQAARQVLEMTARRP